MPKLSIITVNLNNAAGLQKTIESVVNQTFTDYEYIIIDGGSTDGSLDIIKQYADKISYWVSERDVGIYNAMNKGISKANTEWICFINSGDYYLNKSSLEVIFRYKKEKSSIVYSGFLIYDEKNFKTNYFSFKNNNNKFDIFQQGFAHCSTFYKKDLFEKIGKFDEKYIIAADLEWNYRALIKHKIPFQYIETATSIFEIGGISSNPKFKIQNLKELSQIKKLYFTKFENKIFNTNIVSHILNNQNFLLKIIVKLFKLKLNKIY